MKILNAFAFFFLLGGVPLTSLAGMQSVGSCGDALGAEDSHFFYLDHETRSFDAEARQRMRKFLKFASYPVSNYSYAWDQLRSISILNVGAGIGPENYLYSHFFGSSSFLESAPGAKVWSIEKNPSFVDIAQADNQTLKDEGRADIAESVHIQQGDASDPLVFKDIPPIDILIVRHPNAREAAIQVDRNERGWKEIFENAFLKLAPGGIAIITFYLPTEPGMIDTYWKSNPSLKILDEGANPYSNGIYDSFYVILTKIRD